MASTPSAQEMSREEINRTSEQDPNDEAYNQPTTSGNERSSTSNNQPTTSGNPGSSTFNNQPTNSGNQGSSTSYDQPTTSGTQGSSASFKQQPSQQQPADVSGNVTSDRPTRSVVDHIIRDNVYRLKSFSGLKSSDIEDWTRQSYSWKSSLNEEDKTQIIVLLTITCRGSYKSSWGYPCTR